MYYLYRLLDESLSPLDPNIPMIFGSGLLTGLVPSAARGNLTSWSPESGVLLDCNAGDYFPSFLRMNGFDHVVLYGKAPAWTLIMIREKFEEGNAYQIAEVYAASGAISDAFDWLDRAFKQRDPGVTHARVNPRFKPLHEDTRWADLLLKIGLDQ